MKILVLETSLYPTGALKSILALTSSLLKNGYSFEFVMNETSLAANLVRQHGYKLHHMHFAVVSRSLGVFAYPFKLLYNAIQLRRIAAKIQADIIHVNDIYNLSGLVASRIGPKSFAVIQHCRLLRTSYIRPLFPIYALFARKWADAIIAVSQAVANDLGTSNNTHVVHDALEAIPKLAPKNYENDMKGCNFLYIGNFVRGKGHNVAILAFAILKNYLPMSKLFLVGAGERGEFDQQYVNDLISIVQKYDLNGKVFFSPAVDDVEARMKLADVVLNFSYSESFSMVCLEALTYGLPLIATDCGGPAELINDGVTGLLIPVGDVSAAVAAMMRLATDPAIARSLGETAAKQVPTRFSLEQSSNEMARIYKSAAARQRMTTS